MKIELYAFFYYPLSQHVNIKIKIRRNKHWVTITRVYKPEQKYNVNLLQNCLNNRWIPTWVWLSDPKIRKILPLKNQRCIIRFPEHNTSLKTAIQYVLRIFYPLSDTRLLFIKLHNNINIFLFSGICEFIIQFLSCILSLYKYIFI